MPLTGATAMTTGARGLCRVGILLDDENQLLPIRRPAWRVVGAEPVGRSGDGAQLSGRDVQYLDLGRTPGSVGIEVVAGQGDHRSVGRPCRISKLETRRLTAHEEMGIRPIGLGHPNLHLRLVTERHSPGTYRTLSSHRPATRLGGRRQSRVSDRSAARAHQCHRVEPDRIDIRAFAGIGCLVDDPWLARQNGGTGRSCRTGRSAGRGHIGRLVSPRRYRRRSRATASATIDTTRQCHMAHFVHLPSWIWPATG